MHPTERAAVKIASWLSKNLAFGDMGDHAFIENGYEFMYEREDNAPTIVWEEGPYEWAYVSFQSEAFADMCKELGVWTEALTSWALSVYHLDEGKDMRGRVQSRNGVRTYVK